MKMVCFDMDGTLADLYAVDNWLEKLQSSNPEPYATAEPLWDMDLLNMAIAELHANGYKIAIITWLSMNSTKAYKKQVREAKLEWLKKYSFDYDFFHGVAYGTTKANCVRSKTQNAILVDDNKKVLNGWTLGKTINPTECDLIKELIKIAKNP